MELGEHARAASRWGAASSAWGAPSREAAELRGLCAGSFGPFATIFPEQEPWRRSCKDLSRVLQGGHCTGVTGVESLYPVSGNLVSSGDKSTPKLQLLEFRQGLWLVSQGRAGSWKCRDLTVVW